MDLVLRKRRAAERESRDVKMCLRPFRSENPEACLATPYTFDQRLFFLEQGI